MKALALLTAVAVTLFSVAASAQTYGAPYGKGKAPPPPVVTKGLGGTGFRRPVSFFLGKARRPIVGIGTRSNLAVCNTCKSARSVAPQLYAR